MESEVDFSLENDGRENNTRKRGEKEKFRGNFPLPTALRDRVTQQLLLGQRDNSGPDTRNFVHAYHQTLIINLFSRVVDEEMDLALQDLASIGRRATRLRGRTTGFYWCC